MLTVDEVATSKAELLSYVVEARRHHSESGVSSGDIKDERVYLLRQYSFQSRHCLTRVFQLCCLFIELLDEAPAPIEFDFSECLIRPGVLTSCLRSVQSFVSCAGYEQSTFFTETTMDSVRRSLDAAEAFMSNASFNPKASFMSNDSLFFLGWYPTLVGEFVGEAGGLSMSGGLDLKGLSPMSMFMFVKPGSVVVSSSFISGTSWGI